MIAELEHGKSQDQERSFSLSWFFLGNKIQMLLPLTALFMLIAARMQSCGFQEKELRLERMLTWLENIYSSVLLLITFRYE